MHWVLFVVLDDLDDLADGLHFGKLLVGDLDSVAILKIHDQLNKIEKEVMEKLEPVKKQEPPVATPGR